MEDLRCVLQKSGFNLTKRVSTNERFLTAVPAEYRALSPVDIPHAEQRILRIPWTLENDTVSANVSKLFEMKALFVLQSCLDIYSNMTTHNCLSTYFATLRSPLLPPLPIPLTI